MEDDGDLKDFIARSKGLEILLKKELIRFDLTSDSRTNFRFQNIRYNLRRIQIESMMIYR